MHNENEVYTTAGYSGKGQTDPIPLTEVVASLRSTFNRSTELRDRATRIREAIAGGGGPAIGSERGPREVPNGMVGEISEIRESLSSCFETIETELERIIRALGLDRPSTPR
jgi:hypothetical protein